jgi:phosphoglycerate dehydrogenase-like enzyme
MFGNTSHTLSFGETEAEFHAGVAEAEALVTATGALPKFYPCPSPQLKLIFCTSAGLDRLVPFDWLPSYVALLNNRGAHATRAGEYAAMALLMLAGQMPALIAAQQAGRWEKRYASSLRGRHLAVLGTGDLGAAGGRQGRHFGMRTTGIRTSAVPHPDFDRVVASANLDALLPEVEFLLLAAPLTPATRGILTRARLELLPQGAFVINVGRGALIDQDALCDLLDSGHLGGAVLDVFTPEPIPPGHRLWSTRNLVITPHVSADDPATYATDSVRIFLDNLAAFEAGLPMPNRFDTARGY